MGANAGTVSTSTQGGILIGLGIIAAGAIGLHALATLAERAGAYERHLDTELRVGCRAMETPGADPTGALLDERFVRWSWTVLSDPDVKGAALIDPAGAIVGLQPEDLGRRESLEDPLRAGARTVRLEAPLGTVAVRSASIEGGYRLVLLARRPDMTAWTADAWWVFPLAMTLLCGVGWCWIREAMRRSLWTPLRRMIVETSAGGVGRLGRLPTDRKDDIGTLARHFSSITESHERFRMRVGSLERTMDVKVAERTRRIRALLKQAERKAWIDPLTKLGNRNLLDDRLEKVFSEQVECGEDMSIIVFDLDNFKALNDSLGHQAGDELLSFFGELLRGSLRSSDVALRLGGDEFVVILLGTSSSEAAESAERLVKLFGQRASLLKVSPKVTISAGVASRRGARPDTGADLLREADRALYDSKRQGKGRASVRATTIARSPTG